MLPIVLQQTTILEPTHVVLERYLDTMAEDRYSRRERHLKTTYNLSLSQFDAHVQAIDEVCPICTREFQGVPNCDHDHNTGHIRGILCRSCNILLGLANDNPVVLDRAASYLRGDALYSKLNRVATSKLPHEVLVELIKRQRADS